MLTTWNLCDRMDLMIPDEINGINDTLFVLYRNEEICYEKF